MNNNEVISHHGILGQKWGIRRYQNPDGSLTPAGRRKAQKLKGDYKTLTGKKLKGKIPDEDPNKKPVRKLTDTELKDRINRLTAEKQALSLERDLSSNGQKFVRSVGKDILAPAMINAGRNLLEKKLMQWGSDALGLNKKEVKDSLAELRNEAEKSRLKKQKRIDDDWLKKKVEQDKIDAENNKKSKEESNKNQNKSQNEKETVYVYEFYKDKTEQKRYADSGKKVYDAVYEEKSSTPVSSQLLLEDKKRGQKLLGFYN